jgi:hypothetical protein
VNGPGTVILIFLSGAGVLAQELHVAHLHRVAALISPTTRGTGTGSPLRSSAVPLLSMSTPSSAVAKRFE